MQNNEKISVSLDEYHRKISQTIHDEFEKVNERFDSQKESIINADIIKIELHNVEEHIRTELRDYNNLQHIIEQKSNEAVEKVDAKLRMIGWCASVVVALGLIPALCWFRDFVTDKVTEKYVTESLQTVINTKVSEMIMDRILPVEKELRNEFSQIVSNEVEKINVKEKELKTKIAIARFYLDVMMKVNDLENGSRVAYDEMRKYSSLPNPIGEIAAKYVKRTQEKYQREKEKPFRTIQYSRIWTSTMPPKDISLAVKSDKHPKIIEMIQQIAETKQTQYVSTLCYAIEHSKNLEVVYEAIYTIDILTKRTTFPNSRFPALGIDEVLEWWKTQKSNPKFYLDEEMQITPDYTEKNTTK